MAEHFPPITIAGEEHSLPFSKGRLAQSMTATGVPPALAYQIAQRIEEDLRASGQKSISPARLRAIAEAHLERSAGQQYARRYRRIRSVLRMPRPLIMLIGGTTGVGKSTIATELAHRLGIVRIVSTDSIRQVMRGIFSKDLMPTVYESAFSAWKGLRVPVPEGANPVIVGFREQTAVVTTGVKAIIDRAVLEGTSMVIEGVHVVPGYLDPEEFEGARVVQLVISVDDVEAHLSHFFMRDSQGGGNRPAERYRAEFASIRVLGTYIEQLARERGIPVVCSHEFDSTVEDVLEFVLSAVEDDEMEPKSSKEEEDSK